MERRSKKAVTGHEDPKPKNVKAALEKPSIGSVHWGDLHDEDADRAGQKIDEATGKALYESNSADIGHEILTQIIDPTKRDDGSEDLLGKVDDGTDDDEAARWLKAHGEGK